MNNSEDKQDDGAGQTATDSLSHEHSEREVDRSLRVTALEHARGAHHKAATEVIADAKSYYHFLTTEKPLTDEQPKACDTPEVEQPKEKIPGPIEHYTEQQTGQNELSEQQAAYDTTDTVLPPEPMEGAEQPLT